MVRMLPGIQTVEQHQQRLRDDPDGYRPERCPRCGKAGLHHHGHYERNAPVSATARALASIEVMFGQFYMTILVAGLVAAYMQRSKVK